MSSRDERDSTQTDHGDHVEGERLIADAPSDVDATAASATAAAAASSRANRVIRLLGIRRTWAEVLYALGACMLYLLIGPSLILVNRTLLKEKRFNYPMAVSSLGLLFSSAVSFVLVWCKCVRLEQRELVDTRFFLRNLLPIGAAMACTLATGNAVYLYLPVSFIQMLKAFTPSVTLTMLYLTGIEVPSRNVVVAVVGICVGTAVASIGEGSFHLLGMLLMLLAEVSEATRLVLAQKLLQNLKFGVIEGQFFMAPVSALWLCGASALVELPRALRSRHAWSVVADEPLLFLTSAALGFAVNIATFLVIKSTNSVTLKVLGTARNAGLVLVSSWLYDESITRLEAAGYMLSLGAFGAYNYFKIMKL